MRLFLLIGLIICSCHLSAQQISALELLERSIQFHDPMGKWEQVQMEFIVAMEVPERPTRISKVQLDQKLGSFSLSYVSKGHLLSYQINRLDSALVFADFQLATGRTDIDSLDLSADRAKRWRDYYGYLYGLPMKLKDPGTIIDEEVRSEYFNGQEVLSIRVSYEENVGADVWYFYFHPETYAMVGYRFYHDETINDGEFIVLDDMEIQNGLRIPKNRYWYVNEDARFLGADLLLSLTFN